MAKRDYFDDLIQQGDLENFDSIEYIPPIKNAPPERQRLPHRRQSGPPAKQFQAKILAELVEADSFDFSYHASRHEREWIENSLGRFYDQQWFDDVLRLIKGGKEASVYQCLGNATTNAEYIAAKVYRPRQFRALKNDHIYQEGRSRLDDSGNVVINDGMNRAMDSRSEYGLRLLHTSWIEHEFKTMRILRNAGVDIPIPYTSGDNAILMEYIGGAEMAAPPLNTIELTPSEARPLFERCLHNIELMLAHERVHADFSAFNILYWEGEMTIIDFPQAINPKENLNAFAMFERDVLRICEYFARQGIKSNPQEIAAKIWAAYKYRMRPALDPKYLDDENEEDRTYWDKFINE
jgi:RIO kinase 1